MKTNVPHTEKTNAWRFVEQYYPNYHSCNDIAENDDLSAYLSDGKESETYNNIRTYMLEKYAGWCGSDEDLQTLINEEVSAQLAITNARIYERAIEAYMQTMSTSNAQKNSIEFSADYIAKRCVEVGIPLSYKECEQVANTLIANMDETLGGIKQNSIDEAIAYAFSISESNFGI